MESIEIEMRNSFHNIIAIDNGNTDRMRMAIDSAEKAGLSREVVLNIWTDLKMQVTTDIMHIGK